MSHGVLEPKGCENRDDSHPTQCLPYLKGTRIHPCLPFNFGNPEPQMRRVSR